MGATGMKQGNVSKHLGVLVSGSAVGFEIRRAMSQRRVQCVIVQQATNDPVFELGFAVEEQNLAWTGHLAGRQSLANKKMDSPEAQPYPL